MRVIKIGGRVQKDAAVFQMIADAWLAGAADAPAGQVAPSESVPAVGGASANGVHAQGSASAQICVVHGGGDEVSSLQRLMGLEPVFRGGRRVTSEQDIDVLRMGLSGSSNKRIVAALQNAGAPAVGLSGEDGTLIGARKASDAELGLVGTPERVNAALLHALLNAGYMPVISPMGRSVENGSPLNINGDDAAAAIAGALHATELLLIADVSGVLHNGAVVPALSAAGAEALISDGSATGGMIAKLESALLAISSGVQSVRIGGSEMIRDPRAGTSISSTSTPSMV